MFSVYHNRKLSHLWQIITHLAPNVKIDEVVERVCCVSGVGGTNSRYLPCAGCTLDNVGIGANIGLVDEGGAVRGTGPTSSPAQRQFRHQETSKYCAPTAGGRNNNFSPHRVVISECRIYLFTAIAVCLWD